MKPPKVYTAFQVAKEFIPFNPDKKLREKDILFIKLSDHKSILNDLIGEVEKIFIRIGFHIGNIRTRERGNYNDNDLLSIKEMMDKELQQLKGR